MKLTLNREDLKPEHESTNCSLVKFEHLNEKAQLATRLLGRATFFEYDQSSYNAVFPPEEAKDPAAAPGNILENMLELLRRTVENNNGRGVARILSWCAAQIHGWTSLPYTGRSWRKILPELTKLAEDARSTENSLQHIMNTRCALTIEAARALKPGSIIAFNRTCRSRLGTFMRGDQFQVTVNTPFTEQLIHQNIRIDQLPGSFSCNLPSPMHFLQLARRLPRQAGQTTCRMIKFPGVISDGSILSMIFCGVFYNV